MMLQANVGLEPWSVLQQGIAQTCGITYGVSSILVGAAVILIAIACGERVGLGTVANIILCGVFIDSLLALGWIPQMTDTLPGVLMLLAGLELLALGTWLYMRSALGSGPRDALMVAMARKTGRSVGLCRAAVELVIIFVGWRPSIRRTWRRPCAASPGGGRPPEQAKRNEGPFPWKGPS